jgi:hypothetical protein
MIKLTDCILENYIPEYSDEEKKKMGIPTGAIGRGGKWYSGDTYVGKVINGKFVAAGNSQQDTSPSEPKTTEPPKSQSTIEKPDGSLKYVLIRRRPTAMDLYLTTKRGQLATTTSFAAAARFPKADTAEKIRNLMDTPDAWVVGTTSY